MRFGDPNQSPVPTRYESVTGWSEQHRHRAQLTEHAKNAQPMTNVSGWDRQTAAHC